MTFSSLREEILMALYQEHADEGGIDPVSFKKLAKDYDIDWQNGLLIEVQKDLLSSGLIRGPSNGMNDEMAVGRLSGAGMRYIEDKYGSKDGVGVLMVRRDMEDLIIPVESHETSTNIDFALPAGPTTPQAGSAPTFSDAALGADHFDSPQTSEVRATDSRAWTGAQHILVDRKIIEEVQIQAENLRRLVDEIYIPNNAQSVDLKSLVDVLIQVLAMCEPEVTLIDRILASPKFQFSAKLIGAVAVVRGACGI